MKGLVRVGAMLALLALPAPARAQSGAVPLPDPSAGPAAPVSPANPAPAVPRFGDDPRAGGSAPGLSEGITEGWAPGRMGTVLSGAVDPKVYRVGPGDVLQLQMWGRVTRSITLEVGPEGVILLPGLGTVVVNQHTLERVSEDILRRMHSEFRGVNMDLRLLRPRQFRIYLTGEVGAIGPQVATGAMHVSDVLTSAMLKTSASRRRIEVRHKDGTTEFADLDRFERGGRARFDPWLRDGDVIFVPVATDFLYSEGALARPGRYELGREDSLLTLFELSGDPLPAADAERALLIRWRKPFQPESLWFRLDEVYSGRMNPVLREGDRLYVYYIPQYHLQHQATIAGEVARPGVYPILEGRHRLSDLVAAAGGFLPAADLSSIRVLRRGPGAGERDSELERLLRLSRRELTASEYEVLRTKLANQREEYRVDWTRLQSSKEELDLLLRDGDFVRIERLVSSIRVDGEVNRPGILTYVKGLTVEDYVRQAGGFTNRAARSKIRVSRAVTGQTILAHNVRSLDPGDLIWVPERPDKTRWEYMSDLLTAMAQLATVVIAVRSVR